MKATFSVEVRDKDYNLYKTENGRKVLYFNFEGELDFAEHICRQTFEDYKAICKEGSDINIEVKVLNSIAGVYMTLYSFYGANNKFIKH